MNYCKIKKISRVKKNVNNRIVVDYGDVEQLVLLGAIKTKTEEEMLYEDLKNISLLLKMPLVKRYDGLNSFEEIKALNWENKEGVVIRFSNGYRMKIKFEDYVALHRILTNCSSYDIWENLMKFGELPKELFEKVPDEFFGWVRETRDSIVEKYKEIEKRVKADHEEVMKSLGEGHSDFYFSKFYAQKIEKHPYKGLLFSLKNGKDISLGIWKLCKPEYSKPFADNG